MTWNTQSLAENARLRSENESLRQQLMQRIEEQDEYIAELSRNLAAQEITISDLRQQLQAATAEKDTEKRRRVYYQSIVYAVCNKLDSCNGKTTGIVCGTVKEPSTDTEDALEAVLRELTELREKINQVDEVLVVNWIDVKDGNYKQALHDFARFEILLNHDPSMGEEHVIQKHKADMAELQELRAFHELADEVAGPEPSSQDISHRGLPVTIRDWKNRARTLAAKLAASEVERKHQAALSKSHLAVYLGAEQKLSAALERVAETEKEKLGSYLRTQWEWSAKTFGNGRRTLGILDHIKKELLEIEAQPTDLSEWVDVVILAMDGYWRHGGQIESLMNDMRAKQVKNMARSWPAPSEDVAVEHDRSQPPTQQPEAAPQGDEK